MYRFCRKMYRFIYESELPSLFLLNLIFKADRMKHMKQIEKDEKEIKEIIFRFLDTKKYQVFIFGSRATGKAKKFSDYDIGISGKDVVSSQVKILIEEALEESNLPYKVDIVDFSLVSSNFKKIALSKIKKL